MSVPEQTAGTPPPENGSHQWVSQSELQAVLLKLREAQETLEAIQSGDVDAVVVSGERGSQIYTLTGAEEPYRIFVEGMQEGAVTVSESGLILYSNRKFAEFLDRPLEKVISSPITGALAPGVWEQILSGTAEARVAKLETEVKAADGRSLPVLVTANPLATLDEPVLCLVVTDLSAQKEQLRLAMEKELAEAANRSKDAFLAVLSHELRTPLTPALMGTFLLERDPGLSAKSREVVTMIRRNVEVETRLIDDLLDLTRITQGKIQLQRLEVDLHEVIRDALAVCQMEITDQSQDVRLELDARSHRIMGDPVRLQQILWNLIRNASKFSKRGGVILIRTWNAPGGALKIAVIDQGVGMEPEILEKLFTPFEQGGEAVTRKFGGLGLGLVISRSIAEMHAGGSIEAASDGKGLGSRFTLTFTPLDRITEPAPDGPASGKVQVLVVEDDEDSRTAVTLWLEFLGYEVVETSNVADAIKAADERNFDVLLSDIGLPDASGYDLMVHLRGRPGLVGIAMSGFGQREDLEKSRTAGFTTHLIKPVAPGALESAMEAALKDRELPAS